MKVDQEQLFWSHSGSKLSYILANTGQPGLLEGRTCHLWQIWSKRKTREKIRKTLNIKNLLDFQKVSIASTGKFHGIKASELKLQIGLIYELHGFIWYQAIVKFSCMQSSAMEPCLGQVWWDLKDTFTAKGRFEGCILCWIVVHVDVCIVHYSFKSVTWYFTADYLPITCCAGIYNQLN